MDKVLVTGGAGLIGSRVVRKFLEECWKVTVVDDFSTGEPENIPSHPNIQVIIHDITVNKGLEKLFTDVDVVVHLAAVSSIPACEGDVGRAFEVNVRGLENVLNASAEGGVDLIVFSSSAAVYGEGKRLSETTPPKPLSVYGHTKLIGENMLRCLSEEERVRAAVLRIFNVYGRTRLGKGVYGVVDQFIDDAVNRRPLRIFGDGEQVRDFIHVDDVADAVYKIVEKFGKRFDIYNIGSGTGLSVKELAHIVLDAFKKEKLNIVYEPIREGDIRYSVADISKARTALGFQPRHDLREYVVTRAKNRRA